MAEEETPTEAAVEEVRQQQHDEAADRVKLWDEERIAALEARLSDTGTPSQQTTELVDRLMARVDDLERKLDRTMTEEPVQEVEEPVAEPEVAEIPAESPPEEPTPQKKHSRAFRIF